jgi:hypothetical protein
VRKREIEKLEKLLQEGPKNLSQAWILATLKKKYQILGGKIPNTIE